MTTMSKKKTRNIADAKLRRAIHEYAEHLGEAVIEENERLRRDPDFVIDADAYAAGLRVIEQHFAEAEAARSASEAEQEDAAASESVAEASFAPKADPHPRRRIRPLRYIAAAAIAMALTVTAYAVSPSFRAWARGLTLEKRSEVTFFSYEPNIGSDTNWSGLFDYGMPETPDGFEIVLHEEFDSFRRIEYLDDIGNNIWISITKYGLMGVDTEDSVDSRNIEISGCGGIIFTKDDAVHLVLTDEQTDCNIDIMAYGVSEEIVVTLAEQLLQIN